MIGVPQTVFPFALFPHGLPSPVSTHSCPFLCHWEPHCLRWGKAPPPFLSDVRKRARDAPLPRASLHPKALCRASSPPTPPLVGFFVAPPPRQREAGITMHFKMHFFSPAHRPNWAKIDPSKSDVGYPAQIPASFFARLPALRCLPSLFLLFRASPPPV